MKTILIAHNYTENSFASLSFCLAHHLADLGNRIVFISHKPFYEKNTIIKKIKGEIIICSWSSENRPTSIKDVFWFSKIYYKYKPTVVIGHFVGANISIGMSKILSFSKVKTFSYYHTLHQQIMLDQKKTVIKSKLLFFRKKIFYNLFCDTVVCPSEMAKIDFEKFYSKKGIVILNPMKDRFKGKSNSDENSILISYLGRFDHSKGVVELIEAFKIYNIENNSSKIILNIAGSGSLKEEIEKQVSLESKINYLGGLSYDKIDDYLSNKSHFTIIPSKQDALNMVGIESMMNQTPLLISNTAGLANYLDDGKECFKFDSNIESIISLFYKVEKNFDKREKMGINARNTFLTKFNMETYCVNFSNEIAK